MPIIDAPIDEEFRAIRLAANEIVRHSYKWLLGAPPRAFSDVRQFLSYFDKIESRLNEDAPVADIFKQLEELAIAAKISTFANGVTAIKEDYKRLVGAPAPGQSNEQMQNIETPDSLKKKIRELFSYWRSRFDEVAGMKIPELRNLPSIGEKDVVGHEVRAFATSLRLEEARAEMSKESFTQPVVRCKDGLAHVGTFQLALGNFSIYKGDIVVCVGPNGSGKTTLLEALAGRFISLEDDDTLISFPFIDTAHLESSKRTSWLRRRKQIAFVAEQPELGSLRLDKRISLNLAESGVLGDSNQVITNLILERFRLFGKTERHSWQLSDGERKLAALACALSMAPDLLILDEPLSSLDYMAVMHFLNDLKNVAKGVMWGNPAVVFSAHSLDESILIADRILFLTDGQLRLFNPSSNDSIFEVMTRTASEPPTDATRAQDDELTLLHLNGRTFVTAPKGTSLSKIAIKLESLGIALTSISDITYNPKRSYLGI